MSRCAFRFPIIPSCQSSPCQCWLGSFTSVRKYTFIYCYCRGGWFRSLSVWYARSNSESIIRCPRFLIIHYEAYSSTCDSVGVFRSDPNPNLTSLTPLSKCYMMWLVSCQVSLLIFGAVLVRILSASYRGPGLSSETGGRAYLVVRRTLTWYRQESAPNRPNL